VPATLTLSTGKKFTLTDQEAELLRGAAEKVTAE
jgi:hypothetical protein